MNLLEETIKDIEESGHTPDDIAYIGNRDGYGCTWDEFRAMADVEYDDSFGCAEVATDLEIVFKDGSTMYRCEYDGSEWWGYSMPFPLPEEATKPIRRLVGRYWPTLARLADENDTHHAPVES